MKHPVRWLVVLVVTGVLCSVVTYRIAWHRGYAKGLDQGLGNAYFTESMGTCNALWLLRAGDVAGGTRQLETECFASAKIYYNNPTLDPDSTRALAKDLSVYRAAYRTNSAEWDKWEQKLEPQLAKIKSADEKAWAGMVIKPPTVVFTNRP